MARTLKPGMRVTIFQEPLTRYDLSKEGKATLIERIDTEPVEFYEGRQVQRWEVEFDGDDGMTVERIILQ